jgi:hypothetical protein
MVLTVMGSVVVILACLVAFYGVVDKEERSKKRK